MAVIPVIYDEGQHVSLLLGAETFAKGDMCIFNASGHMIKVVAGGNVPVFYVILEDILVAPSAGGREALFARTFVTSIFEADTAGTLTQALMGTYLDISAAGIIDQAASVDDLFFAERIISSTKVQGWFKGFTVEA